MSTGIDVISTKVKKSVALSGVMAGNTAVCTVGRTGNDLHYRGYDIVELANQAILRGGGLSPHPRRPAHIIGAQGL